MLMQILVTLFWVYDTKYSDGWLFFTEKYCLHTQATVGYFVTLTVSKIVLYSLFR
jgi:hypothetical protein